MSTLGDDTPPSQPVGFDLNEYIYTLIETAKLNNVDPQAWLEDVLRRLPDHPARRLADLLPWNWQPRAGAANLAA